MNLTDIIKLWDTNLFLLINGFHSPFFDSFMYVVSEKFMWIPLYISVLFVLIKHWKKEAIWLVLALILCIVLSDQVSSDILKNLVKRLRPSHVDKLKGLVHLVNGYSGGNYGFASSHAANAIGFAMLSSLVLNKRIYTYSIFTWAIITAYSRIYLGVHYPLDVFGGLIIGVLAALGCYWLIYKFRPGLIQPNANANDSIEKQVIMVPVLVLYISYFGIIVFSIFH
jgi:undecaprenyl-diphosphatase